MTARLVGIYGDEALFRVAEDGVILNIKTLDVSDPMPFIDLPGERFSTPAAGFSTPELWTELATAAATSLNVRAVSAGAERSYAVPKAVQNEARRALDWQALADVPVAGDVLSMARTLSVGGAVGLSTVRNVARFFPLQDGTQFQTGWAPGTEGFPSKARVTFSAYGGDAAKRWTRRVLASSDAMLAAAEDSDLPNVEDEPVDPGLPHQFVDDDGDGLCDLDDLPADDQIHQENAAADDGQDADPTDPHMFKDDDGDGLCDLCGNEESDVLHVSMGSAAILAAPVMIPPGNSDALLDDFYSDFIIPDLDDEEDATYLVDVDLPDTPERSSAQDLYVVMPDGQVMCWRYGMWQPADLPEDEAPMVELDPDTAWEIGQSFYDDPDTPVALSSTNPGEAAMVAMALPEIDWTLVDRAIELAGDGIYTPEERSQNATKQVRDKHGRFAKYGSQVRLPSGDNGYITRVDPDTQSVEVEGTDGQRQVIPANQVEVNPAVHGEPQQPLYFKPDFSRIKGQPRATSTTPKAWLPKLLPIMDARAIHQFLEDYQRQIDEYRRKHQGETAADPQTDQLNPDNSDVPPLHLAIVDKIDRQAVTDLIALVPASATSSQPVAWRRVPGTWERADDVLAALKSVNPPAVVTLDDATYQAVIQQVDSAQPAQPPAAQAPASQPVAPPAASMDAVQAAGTPLLYGEYGEILPVPMTAAGEGGLDRNRGNAERLRHYWTYGPGGAKIRWGEPGDFNRCVRHLGKYLGVRAKGYCQLRHHEVTHMYTSEHAKLVREGHLSNDEFLPAEVYPFPSLEDFVIASGIIAAGYIEDGSDVPADPEAVTPDRQGSPFRIPLVIPEDVESGDGRKFLPNSLSMRDMPIPLLWQIQTDDGHTGSVIIGRIDRCDRIPGGLGNATGVMDTGPYGREAERLMRAGMLRGVSADLDQFKASTENADEESGEDDIKTIGGDKMSIKSARLMAVTAVPKPAFQECFIQLDPVDESGF